ncbi:protein starmaker isoform X2 [Drosophila serrata]|uniref:protein starmaker isoform X2 n=1 Tax=Drosophila serrata TaxID=7274 RepID=UPI000A1CF8DB|nr:protein starmaker isoform X2 [Drosophila serrata]
MSSPDQCDDDFWFTMDSPSAAPMEGTEVAYENFLEKPDENVSSASLSAEGNAMGFDDFIDTTELPPVLNTLEEDSTPTPETQDQEKKTVLKPKGVPLKEYPFILKLYLAASSDAIPMINWSPNGLQLVIDYQTLQHHLTAGSQIFRSRSVLQFTETLMAEGFVRIHEEEMHPSGSEAPTLKPMLLCYRQHQFVRGDLDSLHKLMKENLLIKEDSPMGAPHGKKDDEADDEEAEFPVPLHLPSKMHLKRMQHRGDKCCSTVSIRSPIQEARCRFRTLLDHLAATKVVQASAKMWEKASMRKGRPWDFPTFTSSSIKFVRPQDSVITLDANKPLPEYAGYYGRVSPTKVTKFFSEYLPRYGNKTTGYKDIVLETSTKPSNFQQNLPIGLDYSDSDDNEPNDNQPAVSPPGQDCDLDFMPSTSAAAAAAAAKKSFGHKKNAEPVDDQDLEEAMQELCGGSAALKENGSSGNRGKTKAQPQPKSPNATSRKRRPISYESSSSEEETVASRKAKRAKKVTVKGTWNRLENTQEEAIEDDQEVVPKGRGPKSKVAIPKATTRKRFASSNKDEATPPRKRPRKGDQDNRKLKNTQLEGLEEFLVKKKGGKADQENEGDDDEDNENESDYENEEEDAEENQNDYNEENEAEYLNENEDVLQDDLENPQEDEYLEEDIVEGGEYLENDIGEEGEYLEEHLAEEDEQSEHQFSETFERPQELSEEDDPEEQHLEGEGHSEGEVHPEEEGHPEGEGHLEEEVHPEEYHREYYSEEDERPEENMNADENQEDEVYEDIEEDLEAEDGEDAEDDQNAEENEEVEENEEAEEDSDTEENEEAKENSAAKEKKNKKENSDSEEDEDDDDDTDDNDDDDDDDDYSVQYRTTAVQPEKPRRYDLRNSMRKPK